MTAAAVYAGDGKSIYLSSPMKLNANFAGDAALAAGGAAPLSLTADDFDMDGYGDLAVGYATADGGRIAIFRGSRDAFAPQSQQSFDAIGRSEFPSPLLPSVQIVTLPSPPDFLAAGMFIGHDGPALVAATRGGHAIYVIARDASGNFQVQQTIPVAGSITVLQAFQLARGQYVQVVAGIHGVEGPSLSVYTGSNEGLMQSASLPLSGDATALASGDLDGDSVPDLLVVAGGKASILHGASQTLESLPLQFVVSAAALGRFIFDRDSLAQMALLGTSGDLHLLVQDSIDQRPFTAEEIGSRRASSRGFDRVARPQFPEQRTVRWKEIESYSLAGLPGQTGQAPMMFRTRISSNGADDVMLLTPARLFVLAHTDLNPTTGVLINRDDLAADALAALAVRVNVDGRPGVVFLKRGDLAPQVMMPLPDPNIFVNRIDDPTPNAQSGANTCTNTSFADMSVSCSLREAVLKAVADAGPDTIMLQGLTYSLTIGRPASPDYTGHAGALYVNNSMNIVGTAQNSTIIQWGTPATGTLDMVIAVNEDIAPITNATASISNLTIQNGVNHGAHGTDGDGGCMEYDTGSSGTADLNLTNVTIQNCATTKGNGAGIVIFNSVVQPHGGAGKATITNCIFQNNSAVDSISSGTGGGVGESEPAHMVISNSQILNNKAIQNGSQKGLGGGIALVANASIGDATIHSTTISGNKAAGLGGAIYNTMTLTIDQGSVITNNTGGTDGTNPVAGQDGGGIYINTIPTGCPSACSVPTTLTKVTITGNSTTGNGGGIHIGNNSGSGPLSMSFSRLAGNSVGAGSFGSNLNNNRAATATVTNNWWGTNNAASTINTISATTTFDPFIVLTHTASPQKIRINQSSTLTGDMSNDNHGTAVGLSNLTEIIGLPITFDSPVLGTIPQAQPETLNASAKATATFNAGGTSGLGSANATVDQAVVPVNSNLIASATESTTTVTITTVGAHGYSTGEYVKISGVGVAGYNTPANTLTLITGTPTATTFTYTAGSGLASSSGGTANAGIVILAPPSITKSFSPKTIQTTAGTGATVSTITFSITNGNVVPIDASFTDNLPTNVGVVPGSLVVASTPSVVNNCGGSVTANAGAGSISFSNAATAVGTCTITVNVQSSVDNTYNNSVTIDSTDAGNGNTSSDTLTVINPPTILKAFSASTIPLNSTTTLTFTITSTNANLTLTGVNFTDNLPAGLNTFGGFFDNCGGTFNAPNSSTVSLSGSVSVTHGAQCMASLTVKGVSAGVQPNSVQATSTNAGSGNTSMASITVVAPPTIMKSFTASSVPLNGSTNLNFTITNPNPSVSLTGVGFSDTLPAGLSVADATSTVCGGTLTVTHSTNLISLSGAHVPMNSGTCMFSVSVTGTSAGDQVNTTGAVTSAEGGTGVASNMATLTVVAPPTISKAFGVTFLGLNQTTTLTFTITNPSANTVSQTGLMFSDTLTSGLVVANPPTPTTTCTGGMITAADAGNMISFSSGTVGINANCTVTVTVKGTTTGVKNNVTGAVSSTNGGTGVASPMATVTVASPPTIMKSFSPTSVPINTTSTTTFTISNPNSITLNGVAFSDTLMGGLQVAGVPNVMTSGCGGSPMVTATGGTTTISLANGVVAGSGTCTVKVDVTGTIAGVKPNTTGNVSSTEGGTGTTSGTVNLTVAGPPTIMKAFNPTSIALNGTTTITFTIMNPNGVGLAGIRFNDTLPAGLVVAAVPNKGGTCTSTFNPSSGDTSLAVSGIALMGSAMCTVTVDVKGTAAGDQQNTTGPIDSVEGGMGTGSNMATVNVVAPPTIMKGFNPTSIIVNGTTTLTFTITNPAGKTVSELGVAFNDTLPTGLTTPNNAGSTVCGTGTLVITGNNTIAVTGGTVAVNTPCTIMLTVTGTSEGAKTNTTGTVSSTNGGTGVASNMATVTVAAPPTIAKGFNPTQVAVNTNSTLTITITNPNSVVTLNGISFTDTLQSGLVVANPNGLTNNGCGGMASAGVGGTSVSLSNGTLMHGAMCTIIVNVTSPTGGVKMNSVQANSTEGGMGNTAMASVTVVGPPTIMKAFSPLSIPLNGTTTITFTIMNPNNVGLTGISFNDTLPAGLVVAATPNKGGTCTSTFNPMSGDTSLAVSGIALIGSAMCTVTVDVKGTAAGDQVNNTSPINSVEGGMGTGSNMATVNVVAPPLIGKAFNPTSVTVNGTTTLTFTLTDPAGNTVSESGVAFMDLLPTGLTTPNNAGSTVCGTGTLVITGNNAISLTGGTVAVNTPCTIVLTVTGTTEGLKTNTTGQVTSTNGGTGLAATANVTVAAPPTITKAFNPTSIPQNTNTTLTFTINNPNSVVNLTGISFTDTLQPGLVVANPNGLTNNCGGIASAGVGGTSVSLTGGTRAPGVMCTVVVSVTGTTAGTKMNSVQVNSTEGGLGNTSIASVTVVAPPTITKAFNPLSIPLNGISTITFTIMNSNAVGLSGITFIDPLPTGLVVISTTNGCGGTLSSIFASSAIGFIGGTLGPNATCTLKADVRGTTGGAMPNTTNAIFSNEGGFGTTSNTATLSVEAPPSIAKMFGAPNIALNGTTTLTFTITNPSANVDPQMGVAFTDTLPSGLTTPNNAGRSVCGTGTLTVTGNNLISLSGGTVGVNTNCSFSVNVTGTTSGIKTNTTSTVSSTNGGTGNQATAMISVALPPTVMKAFGASSIPLSGTTSLIFTLANPNSTQSLTGIQFTDNLPPGLLVASPTGASNSCGGSFAPAPGNTTLTFTGGSLTPSASCIIGVNVAASSQGNKSNTTTAISSNESGAGSTSNTALLAVEAPPTISKSFSPSTINLIDTTTLTFTLGNPGGNPSSENALAFMDTLPSGLVVASTPNVVNNCGGTVTATPGSGTISLANGMVVSACTISVNVTANGGGVLNNLSGNVSSVNGGTGNAAFATLTVRVADMVMAKSHTDPFTAGSPNSSYTITASNIGPVASFGTVTVTDQLPNGLTPTTLQGPGWNCNLLTLTCTRSDALAPGQSYPPITMTVAVSPTAPASVINTATVSGGAEANTSNDTATDPTNITCFYSFNPPSAFFTGAGGTGSFAVISGNGCPIAPMTTSGFLTFLLSGNTVNYTVAPNVASQGRTGTITVGGQPFTVTQGGATPQLIIQPQKLFFFSDTITAPPSQMVNISGSDGSFFSTSVDVPWAKVSADSNTLPATLTVTVSPNGLQPGNNNGTITLNVGGATYTIFLQYTVFGLTLVPSPTQLTFTYVIGGPLPSSQQLTIFAPDSVAIQAAGGGAGFVSVSPGSGTTPQVFNVSVDVSNKGEGTYPASVVISGNGVSNSPLVVPVNLIVTSAGPQFTAGGVVNGADFLAEPLAPGSLFSIFGTNLANTTMQAGPLPPSLDDVSMTIGGFTAPVQYISPTQVNAQVPFEAGLGQQPLVYTKGAVQVTIMVTIVPAEPGIFLVNGRGAILNQDNTLNTAANAALVGSAVQVFFTGQGLVTPSLATGQPASLTTLMFTNAPTTATIGGSPATVLFSGLAPGFVGLGQANVLVPPLATNDYPLVLTVNGQPSNGATVAVKSP